MKTNKDGKLIQFMVTDDGIQEIDENHEAFSFPGDESDMPVFDTETEALTFAYKVLSARVKQLEDKS